ncbi:MAG: glycosyltransferase [Candidatus Aminicenantes bacterium]
MSRRRHHLPVHLAEIELSALDVDPVMERGPARILVRRRSRILGELTIAAGATVAREDVEQEAIGLAVRRSWWRSPVPEETVPGSPSVSVVVCTRDRPDLLVDCLDALDRCDPQPREIIVVDSASCTSATREVATTAGVRYERLDVGGLDRARNHGWKSAAGGTVLYVDDDARLDPRAVAVVAATMEHESVDAVTGLVLPAEIDSLAQWRFESSGGMSQGFERRVFNERTHPIGLETWRVGVGACMAIRRSLLDDLGGFDPFLDVGTRTRGAGDLDIFYRILSHGGTIVYEPSCMARHVHRSDHRSWIRQLLGYGFGYTAFIEKQRATGGISNGDARRMLLHWHARRRGWQLGRAVRRRDVNQLAELVAEGYGSLFGRAAYRAERRSTS